MENNQSNGLNQDTGNPSNAMSNEDFATKNLNSQSFRLSNNVRPDSSNKARNRKRNKPLSDFLGYSDYITGSW